MLYKNPDERAKELHDMIAALLQQELAYQLQLLDELALEPLLSPSLYLDKTLQAPSLVLGHLPGMRAHVAVV